MSSLRIRPASPDPGTDTVHLWAVLDPSTTLSQSVKAPDAAQAADIAWSRWYGTPPVSDLDLRFYLDLGVTYVGPCPTESLRSAHQACRPHAAWHPCAGVHVAYIAGCPVHRRAHLDQLLEEVGDDFALPSVCLTFCVDSRRYILRFGPFNLVRYTDRAEALANYEALVDQLLPLHPCSA